MTPREQVKSATTGLKVTWHKLWDNPRIAGKGSWAPKFVMLHHTAGLSSLKSLTSAAPYAPVPGAHFLVNRDGSIVVLSRFIAYHAGRGGPRWGVPAGMMNHYAWGIEIEDPGKAQTMTPAQIQATARLVAGLLTAMGKDLDAVIQHKEWNPGGKVDTRYSTSFWRDLVAEHLKPSVAAEVPAPARRGKATTGDQVTWWRDYSGKPKTTQTVPVDERWHQVDGIPVGAPPVTGMEFHLLYARLAIAWPADATEHVTVQAKWVRDGGTPDDPKDDDPTAYGLGQYAPGTTNVPYDRLHFEDGQKGVGGAWWITAAGGASELVITTRYAKTHVIAVQ